MSGLFSHPIPLPVDRRGKPDGPISENAKDFRGKEEVEEEEESRIASQRGQKED
jgi:hypothetical protein